MASIQHHFFKFALSNISGSWNRKCENIHTLRKVLDVSSHLLYMPAHVKSNIVKIAHISGEWLKSKEGDEKRVILYFHGGGYSVGSLQTHRTLAARLAKATNSQSLIIDYRLAPEYPFPAALEDAITAYDWLLDQGFLPENIVFAGDSAGGGLCLACQIKLRETQKNLPVACVCMSPWIDLTESNEDAFQYQSQDPIVPIHELSKWVHLYADKTPASHPLISPFYANLSGLAPLFIQASTTEILTEQAIRLEQKVLKEGGKVILDLWPDMLHVWQVMWQYLPEGEEAIQRIAKFILQHWK